MSGECISARRHADFGYEPIESNTSAVPMAAFCPWLFDPGSSPVLVTV